MIEQLASILTDWTRHEQDCHRDYAPLRWVWWTRGDDQVTALTGKAGEVALLLHAVVAGVHHELDDGADPLVRLRELLAAA